MAVADLEEGQDREVGREPADRVDMRHERVGAQMPKMMLGSAASRSTSDVSVPRSHGGAYSLMNSAMATPSGTPIVIATAAMITVPASRPEDPKRPIVGFQTLVVKNPDPGLDESGPRLVDEEDQRRRDDDEADGRGSGREHDVRLVPTRWPVDRCERDVLDLDRRDHRRKLGR